MARPTHFEICSDNPENAAEFYKSVFGWEIATWNGPQGYWLVTTGANDAPGINGGIMAKHFPQAVINTMDVESLDDMVAKVEAAGGKKVHGPNEIPGVGTHVYCSDPDGTLFGLIEPAAK